MRKVFQQNLAEVQQGLVDIAQRVVDAIQNAVSALGDSDVSLADQVISGDLIIDDLSAQIDDLTLEILLLQAPVANDLRFIVDTMRMSGSLERMGDLAAHIAQLARMRFPESAGVQAVREQLLEMGEHAARQAVRVEALLRTENPDYIAEIIDSDDAVDALHKQVLTTLTRPHEDIEMTSSQIVDATLANRYLERFSDHAVSIARRIRHRVEDHREERA